MEISQPVFLRMTSARTSSPQDQRESHFSPHPFSALWPATDTFPAAVPFKEVLQRRLCFWSRAGEHTPSIKALLSLTLVPPHR